MEPNFQYEMNPKDSAEVNIYIHAIIIGEQGAIGTLTEWQNLYVRRAIMVLGMGLEGEAALKKDVVMNMAKRRKRKDLKKAEALGDMFEIKVKPINDKNFEEQLLYHMRTNRCPYNEKECEPNNCPYRDKGMERCPIHEGTVY